MRKILIILGFLVSLCFADKFSKPFVDSGHSSSIFSVLGSPTGKYILSGDFDGKLILSQTDSLKTVRTFIGHSGYISAIAFSSDEKYILSAGEDGVIRLWDMESGKLINKYDYAKHFEEINSLSFSPNEKMIIANVSNIYPQKKAILAFDINSTQVFQIENIDSLNLNECLSSSFSPGGRFILYIDNHVFKIWDLVERKIIRTFKDSMNMVTRIKFGNATKALSIKNDSLIVWDLINGKAINKFKVNPKWTNSISLIKNGNFAVFGGKDGKLRLWDINLNKVINISGDYSTSIHSIAASSNNKYVISSNSKGAIDLWDIENAKLVKTFHEHTGISFSTDFSPNDEFFISAGYLDGIINIWNLKSKKIMKKFSGNHALVDYSSNYIWSFGHDLKLIDIKSGKTIKTLNTSRQPTDISFDGKYALVCSNRKVELWDIKNEKKVKVLSGHQDRVNTVTLSKDGKYALSGGRDVKIKLWEVNTGRNIETFLGHNNEITSLIFSNSGRFFLSGSDDATLKFWDIQNPVGAMKTLIGHQNSVSSLAWNGIGKFAFSGSLDNTVKLWNLETGKELVSMIRFNDDQYLAITPEGYFNGSRNAAQYLNMTKTTKDGLESFDFSQLYDHFFRPDLVKLKLTGKEKEYQDAIQGMTYQEALRNPPPKLTFTSIDKKKVKTVVPTKKDKASIFFNVSQADEGGVGLIRVYQEGKLIQTIGKGKDSRQAANAYTKYEQKVLDEKQIIAQERHIGLLAMNTQRDKSAPSIEYIVHKVHAEDIQNTEGNYQLNFDLISGANEICIEAFNKTNTVTSYRECVTINADTKKKEPKIYAIVAGVNDFKVDYITDLKYSENDAKAIKDVVEETKGKVYKEVVVKDLLGTEMTKDKLIKAVREVQAKARLEDTILFYISTHGVADNTGLYFIPQNYINPGDEISFKELFHELQSIKSLKQIYIVDSCQSGAADDIVSSVYDSRASIFAKSSGVHLLLSTTKGTYAFESQDAKVPHGIFTAQILDALKNNKTDKDKDSFISVLELSDKLRQPANNVKYQYPVIRNIGNDIKLEKVK